MHRIEEIVLGLCKKHNLRCPYQLAEALGIEVLHYPFEGINGMTIRKGEKFIITLKEGLSPTQERYVLAHELGHIILHAGSYFDIYGKANFLPQKYEKQADLFAAYLIIDEAPEEGESLKAFGQRKAIPCFLLELLYAWPH